VPLIEKGQIVADGWIEVADDAPLPNEGGAIVSLARRIAEAELLRGRNQPLGVRLPTAAQAEALSEHLAGVDLVVVDFPKFRDGRGFTVARDLRERFGFTGVIRAVGNTLPDQYGFLVRCGVDQVEIPAGAKVETWTAALDSFTGVYQTTVGDDRPLSPLKRLLKQA
jgi:uncharacterized protein (DUF934 family)